MVQEELSELYDSQLRAVQSLSLPEQDVNGLTGLVKLSSKAMGAVNDSFRVSASTAGSWVRSHSLPIQLIRQYPLTVDLTPNELKKTRPYGIPFRSLLRLAESKFVYLNLRDYDSNPTAYENQDPLEYSPNESVASRMEELLRHRGSIYIGSALRKDIFDTALQKNGYSVEYETFQQRAKHDWSDALRCFQELAEIAPETRQELEQRTGFRGETLDDLTAPSWHWAFLSAVSHYINTPNLISIEQNDTRLNQAYNRVAQLGSEARTIDQKIEAAATLADLVANLRTCHLNYTAPITASWGSIYNMQQHEYVQASRLPFVNQDHFNSQYNEEYNRFLAYILFENQENEGLGRLREYFHALEDPASGEVTKLRHKVDDNIFDDDAIKSLTEVLFQERNRLQEAASKLEELQNDYLKGKETALERILQLMNDYRRIREESLKVLRQQKRWSELWERVALPAFGVAMGTVVPGPILPWLVTNILQEAVSDRIPEYVLRRHFPQEGQRVIFHVYKKIQGI